MNLQIKLVALSSLDKENLIKMSSIEVNHGLIAFRGL